MKRNPDIGLYYSTQHLHNAPDIPTVRKFIVKITKSFFDKRRCNNKTNSNMGRHTKEAAWYADQPLPTFIFQEDAKVMKLLCRHLYSLALLHTYSNTHFLSAAKCGRFLPSAFQRSVFILNYVYL